MRTCIPMAIAVLCATSCAGLPDGTLAGQESVPHLPMCQQCESPRGQSGRRVGVAVERSDEVDSGILAAMGSALAGAVGGEYLGVVSIQRDALSRAARAGAEVVFVCRILSYRAYDPSRLTVSVSTRSVQRHAVSAADILRMTRSPTSVDALRDESSGQARVMVIDAADRETLDEFAFRCFGDGWGGKTDLLEASILLRDPARFFPFAAELVAEQVNLSL